MYICTHTHTYQPPALILHVQTPFQHQFQPTWERHLKCNWVGRVPLLIWISLEKEKVANLKDTNARLEVETRAREDIGDQSGSCQPVASLRRKSLSSNGGFKSHWALLDPTELLPAHPTEPRGPNFSCDFTQETGGEKICPGIWKRMSPDLIVVLSPMPSVDGYYSMKHKLWQYSLLFLSCFQSSRYKQIILQTEIFSIWVPAPERQHNRKQVRSTIGSTLHKLTHLTLTTGLWDRYYYYPHLTVEKTEAREVKRVACNHMR